MSCIGLGKSDAKEICYLCFDCTRLILNMFVGYDSDVCWRFLHFNINIRVLYVVVTSFTIWAFVVLIFIWYLIIMLKMRTLMKFMLQLCRQVKAKRVHLDTLFGRFSPFSSRHVSKPLKHEPKIVKCRLKDVTLSALEPPSEISQRRNIHYFLTI